MPSATSATALSGGGCRRTAFRGLHCLTARTHPPEQGRRPRPPAAFAEIPLISRWLTRIVMLSRLLQVSLICLVRGWWSGTREFCSTIARQNFLSSRDIPMKSLRKASPTQHPAGDDFRGRRFASYPRLCRSNMQPQGQSCSDLIDRGMNLQEAIDAPRVRALGGLRISVGRPMPMSWSPGSLRWGTISFPGRRRRRTGFSPMNSRAASKGVLRPWQSTLTWAPSCGASDPRLDGVAIGY
jgi:hypothetical protein